MTPNEAFDAALESDVTMSFTDWRAKRGFRLKVYEIRRKKIKDFENWQIGQWDNGIADATPNPFEKIMCKELGGTYGTDLWIGKLSDATQGIMSYEITPRDSDMG